jgi:hypothetical protein
MPKKIIITEKQYGKLIKELSNHWRKSDDFKSYEKEDEDELMEFIFLSKERTGLPVDCYADDGGSFKRHNHPLWFYACNGYGNQTFDVLPISVSDKPQILLDNYQLKIADNDLTSIYQFIKANKKLLISLAFESIDNLYFLSRLDCHLLDENTKGERILLTEMSKVPANNTGLPIDIWVDENNKYLKGGHDPRIKFPATKGEKNSHNYASMSISDNPTPFNLPINKSI